MTKCKPDQRSTLECAKVKMMELDPLIEELSDTTTLYTLSKQSDGINEESIDNNYSNDVVYSSGDFEF